MLFAYGFNSLQRLEELTPMVVRERLSPTFEKAVGKYEEGFNALRRGLEPLQTGTAIMLILDARSKGKLSREEAERLLERAEEGDRSLLAALQEVLANRNRASEATKEERELIKEGTEMKTKEEGVIRDYRDLFDDLLLRSDKEEGESNVNHVTEAEERYAAGLRLLEDLLGTELQEGDELDEEERTGKRTVEIPVLKRDPVHGLGVAGYEEILVEEAETEPTPAEMEDADLQERYEALVDLVAEVME